MFVSKSIIQTIFMKGKKVKFFSLLNKNNENESLTTMRKEKNV